jgi:hypothetical protein
VLGIEAARQVIFDEFSEVMEFSDVHKLPPESALRQNDVQPEPGFYIPSGTSPPVLRRTEVLLFGETRAYRHHAWCVCVYIRGCDGVLWHVVVLRYTDMQKFETLDERVRTRTTTWSGCSTAPPS